MNESCSTQNVVSRSHLCIDPLSQGGKCREVEDLCQYHKDSCSSRNVKINTNKCTTGGENGYCKEISKVCSDYSSTNCGNFKPTDTLKKCVQSSDGKACEEKACADYSKDQCSKFIPNDSNKECTFNSETNKCEEVKKSSSTTNSSSSTKSNKEKEDEENNGENNGENNLKISLSLLLLIFFY